ncbi:MAG: CvpA family protein [Dysgonomonas sp.]
MTWFDIIIIILVIASFIRGCISGLVKQLASLAGIIIGAVFAGQVAKFLSPHILQITDLPDYVVNPLSYLVAFVLILIGFLFLGRMVHSLVEALKMGSLNRLAGAVFSVAKWLIVASILLNVIVEFDQKEKIITKQIKEESQTYPYVEAITPYFIPFLKFDKPHEQEKPK